MNSNTEDLFLIEEYKTAWNTIQGIDERRTKFLQGASYLFVATFGFSSKLLADAINSPSDHIGIYWLCLFSCLVGVVGIAAFRMILKAERKANVRYRNKVNLIREILLATDGVEASPKVKKYLLPENEAIGIKLSTTSTPPKDIGSTLKGVFFIMTIEIISLLALGILPLLFKLLIKYDIVSFPK